MVLAERYTKTAILLHWLIAALMIVNVAVGLIAPHLPEDWIRPGIDTHKSIGLTVLGLAVMRILWRVTHAPPPLPREYSAWERTASHLAHFALYLVIVALPLTGWMHDSAFKAAGEHPLTVFGLFEVPRIGWIMATAEPDKERLHDIFFAWHANLAWALYALVALHVGAALKHQWVDKHRELQRMWR